MRVVITGASRGIGRATALKLAADGAEALTLCDVAYLDELEALAANLRTAGCKVCTLKADMAKYLKSSPAPIASRTLADLIAFDKDHAQQEMTLFGQEQFGRMKRTAVIVNSSRGPVIDEAALAVALRDGEIFGAGLDVF